MPLKYRVKSLDDVAEEHRGLYTEKDGAFVLTVDGLEGVEDTEALRNSKQHEKDARVKAENELKDLRQKMEDLQDEISRAKEEGHKKSGDVEALEKSYQDKLEKQRSDFQGKLDAMSGNLRTVLVDKEAIRMAGKLAIEGSADALLPHITSRLTMDERDGKQVTVVLGEDGKPSATSLEELETEIRNTPSLAPIISGSKASGGGAGGESKGGGASSKNVDLASAELGDRVKAISEKVGAGS